MGPLTVPTEKPDLDTPDGKRLESTETCIQHRFAGMWPTEEDAVYVLGWTPLLTLPVVRSVGPSTA